MRRGLSLVEAAVATVIVGIMLVSALATFDATIRVRNITTSRNKAAALASMLMSEILSRRYEEPVDEVQFGRETGESQTARGDWDDVDDYDGFTQAPPTDADGLAIDGAEKWAWQASVAFVDRADPGHVVTLDTGLKRITVTVTDPRGMAVTHVALRSRFGTRDRTVTARTTFVGHVDIRLVLGGGATGTVTSGTALWNEPAP